MTSDRIKASTEAGASAAASRPPLTADRCLRTQFTSLIVAPGEIVGLAGVSGNGQRELAEALNGLRPVVSGSIALNGAELAGRSVV